ncbi:MAG: hypothetical protein V4685_14520 [Bacteroidota bacterium]
MKKLIALLPFLSLFTLCSAQNVTLRPLVIQSKAMEQVIVKENIEFSKVNDTALHFDIYYPADNDKHTALPVVIFNNGVGSMELLKWRAYSDWARLIAAKGMIAVNYQSKRGHSLEDGSALIDHIIKNAASLHIDADKIGLWTCSANARTGLRLAYKTKPGDIKALVAYYGGPDSLGALRQNLPTLIVRAAKDAQLLNTGIDDFIQSSLMQDTRLEVINYLNGIHAFDIFDASDESKQIILRTVEFLKKNLQQPVTQKEFVLTNKNFMWLINNGELEKALAEFRKARTMYRADSTFQPFYNAVIREDILNTNGYALLAQKPAAAIEVFKLAVETYPNSSNTYESLSEAYETTGDKKNALLNAELSLQKLAAATDLNERTKQIIKESAEARIKRLK